MYCQDILEKLSLYVDGVLDAADQQAVQEHLACCPACRSELEELTLAMGMLQELPELTPPADFRVKLMEKIEQLPAPIQAPQHKPWYERVVGVTRKSWYRTAAVAAVMAMTLGLTALWEKDGNEFLPIDPKPPGVENPSNHNLALEPGETQENPQETNQPETKPEVNTPSQGGTPNTSQPSNTNRQGTKSTPSNQLSVESYVPRSSEGLVSRTSTLKVDVQDLGAAVKALGTVVQNNGGSIVTPYSETGGVGSISVRFPANVFKSAENQLMSLGVVISYLPTEKDLSDQHGEIKKNIEQLQAKVGELKGKLAAEEANQELEKQLRDAENDLNQQIKTIQGLEERSTYGIINITLI